MKKIISSTFISLDGYASRNIQGVEAISWFPVNDEFFELSKVLTDQADTAIYGRKTFEMMNAYWPTAGSQPGATPHDIKHSAWYNRVQKVVISETLTESNEAIIIVSEDIEQQIKKLKQGEGTNIVIFGNPSIVDLLNTYKLIDEYWICVSPTVLGDGKRLFDLNKAQLDLKLIESKTYTTGVVALHYGT